MTGDVLVRRRSRAAQPRADPRLTLAPASGKVPPTPRGQGSDMAGGGSGRPVKLVVEQASKFYETRSGRVHRARPVLDGGREGEFLCVIGPSGCGKTTLLWSMAGLHALSARAASCWTAQTGHRAAPADRDDLPGRQSAALAQPCRRTSSCRSRSSGSAPDRSAIEELLERVGLKRVRATNTRASSRAACSSAPRSSGAWRSIRRCC